MSLIQPASPAFALLLPGRETGKGSQRRLINQVIDPESNVGQGKQGMGVLYQRFRSHGGAVQ